MAKAENITIKQGDARTFIYGNICNPAGQLMQNFTGFEAWLTIKSDISTADTATGNIQLTMSGGRILAANGALYGTLSPTETKALSTTTRYRYDFQIKPPGGNPTTLREGWIVVTPEVTKAA